MNKTVGIRRVSVAGSVDWGKQARIPLRLAFDSLTNAKVSDSVLSFVVASRRNWQKRKVNPNVLDVHTDMRLKCEIPICR